MTSFITHALEHFQVNSEDKALFSYVVEVSQPQLQPFRISAYQLKELLRTDKFSQRNDFVFMKDRIDSHNIAKFNIGSWKLFIIVC